MLFKLKVTLNSQEIDKPFYLLNKEISLSVLNIIRIHIASCLELNKESLTSVKQIYLFILFSRRDTIDSWCTSNTFLRLHYPSWGSSR